MQNEYHFDNSNMERENGEIVVDHWDAIYTLLRKWPLLLAGMLCGAVLFGAFSVKQGKQSAVVVEKPLPIEERAENARKSLGEARASEVEGLYAQYRVYVLLQSQMRNQQAEYLRDLERGDSNYVKNLKYLCSSEDAGPAGIFDLQTVLSEDVCLEIGKIIAGEADAQKAAALSRNRVIIISDQSYKLAVSSEEILPTQYILTVRIIGDDKSQCDQIQAVIEKKMKDIQQAFVNAGGKFEMTPFASEYSNSAAALVKDAVITLSGQTKGVTDNLNSFQLNTIDKLDSSARAYFELLKELRRTGATEKIEETGATEKKEETGTTEKKEETGTAEKKEETGASAQANAPQKASLKSLINTGLVVTGAVAGFFLMTLLILLWYTLTHVIQSGQSFASLCGIPINAAVYKKSPSANGLRLKLYRLLHTADELTRGKAAAIAQDMGIEMDKKNAGSLYLLLSDNSEELSSFAKALSDDMHSGHPNLKVVSGYPLNDQEQMKTLSEADAAVIMVGLKKARREDVVRQLQMCGRYQVPVMGSVTLEVV